MTSRGPRSNLSSPDISPATGNSPYDPFHDPIELTPLSPREGGRRSSSLPQNEFPIQSPDSEFSQTRASSLRPVSYFSSATSHGQYARLDNRKRSQSPGASSRVGKESMYTTNSLYKNKTVDHDIQALVDKRQGEIAQWHVYWTTPALMGSLFLLGVMAAISHHLFYAHLNGKPSVDQLKMVRYGTALAFFVKSTLVGTVVICNRQRIWRTFRTKAMTITGIDGLFSACEDPTQFFLNWEMIRNGKLATLMAALSWLIPIASVLSPAALTSELKNVTQSVTCPSVATLNFSRESFFDYRQGSTETRGVTLMYYNTTDPLAKQPDWFDYYDQPSRNARRLAYTAAFLKKPQPRNDARINFCGNGWNCSYTINFDGPGYKCEDITSPFVSGAPFQLSQLAPQGDLIYLAEVDQNNYKIPQVETVAGVPKNGPPYPDSLGVLESEPILWIGYSIRKPENYSEDSPYFKQWTQVHESKLLKCTMYHTKYAFNMSYFTSQVATLNKIEFVKPVINTTLIPNDNAASSFDPATGLPTNSTKLQPTSWTASPSSNFLRPLDKENYKLTAAYHSMGDLLRGFLRGQVERRGVNLIVMATDIAESRLIQLPSQYPVPDMMYAIQSVFQDMLITLMSEPNLVIAENVSVSCVRSQQVVLFRYYKRSLWIGYAAVIAITLSFVIVGAWSIHQNGVASDVLFSRIMATTRNPTLDHLNVGACLGGDPFPKELTETKLRFGVLLEDDPREGPLGRVEHCCFGTMGETKAIVKGGTYAGLKKYRKGSKMEEGAIHEKGRLLSERVSAEFTRSHVRLRRGSY